MILSDCLINNWYASTEYRCKQTILEGALPALLICLSLLNVVNPGSYLVVVITVHFPNV